MVEYCDFLARGPGRCSEPLENGLLPLSSFLSDTHYLVRSSIDFDVYLSHSLSSQGL